jgi:HK97 family phage portal protein
LRAYRAEKIIAPTPPILRQPNANESRYDTIFSLVVSLLLRGNAYMLLGDFDRLMFPRQVQVLHPDDVQVRKTPDGIVYRIGGKDVPDPSIIKHIRGFCFPGHPTGIGVVQAQREALAHGISLNEFAQRYFSEGAVPPINLAYDGVPDEEGREMLKEIQEQWGTNHARSRKPSVTYGGLSVQTIGFSPQDSQYLESRTWAVHEIANMFGVPPHFLGASDTQVYTSSAWESLNLAKFSLRPWFVRLELAFSDFFSRGTEIQFDMDAILRADQGTRFANMALALGGTRNVGWMTVDEARALEGYEPLPPATENPADPESPLGDQELDDDDVPEGDDAGPGATTPFKPSTGPSAGPGGAAAPIPKNPGVGR